MNQNVGTETSTDLNYLDLLNEMISSTDSEITQTTSTIEVDDANFDSLANSLSAEFGLLSPSTSTSAGASPVSSSILSESKSESKVDYLDMLYELIENDEAEANKTSAVPAAAPAPSALSKSLTSTLQLDNNSADSSLFDLIGEIMEAPQPSTEIDFDALTASITAELDIEDEKNKEREEQLKAQQQAEKQKKEEEKRKRKEEQKKKEEERRKKEEEEWERKRLELESWRKQEEERWRREAEDRLREEAERRKREEEEWRKQREEEEKRRREEIERWKAEEERRRLEELERWKREEEEKRKREEEELRRADEIRRAAEEERRKAEELRLTLERERKIVQEEEERLRQIRLEEERKMREELAKFEEERRKRAEEEHQKQLELAEKARQALEEKHKQLEEELKLQAERRALEEQQRKQQEEEEKRKQEEDWARKRREYEEMLRRLDDEKKKKEEEELREKAEYEQRRKEEEERAQQAKIRAVEEHKKEEAKKQSEEKRQEDVQDLLDNLIASPDKEEDNVGIKFSDLVLGEKLGIGSYGTTYKGTWKGAEVAIKQLAIRNITPAVVDNLLIEVPALRALRHPNLVDFLGVSIDKFAYSVSEHVVGVSLQAFLRRSKVINFPFVLKAALGIASALQFLHSKNITHRALKTKNILLDKKANVRVNDFGLESVKDELAKAISLATPEYLAPELLLQRKFNNQVDVYSFGIILWELCTLQQPYNGMNPKQVILSVVKNGARPPVPQNCPIAFSRLMQACWATDPNKRPTLANIIKLLSQPADLILKMSNGTVANSIAPTQLPPIAGAPVAATAAPRSAPAAGGSVGPQNPSAATSKAAAAGRGIVNVNRPLPAPQKAAPKAQPAPQPAVTAPSKAAPTPTPAPAPAKAAPATQATSNAASVVGKVLDFLKQPNPAAHVKALKALANLVRVEENREALIETENGIGFVVEKLNTTDPATQEEAARVLAILAEDGECTDLIREANGLKPLIDLLSSTVQTVSFEAVKAITKLAENDTNKTAIRTLGGLKPLTNLLSLDENFKMQSAWALSLLLEDEENQKEFTNYGGVNTLLSLLNIQNPALQLRVLVGLGALMISETSNAIRQAGVLQRFIKLLQSKSTTLQKHGVTGIQRFSNLSDLRTAIFKLGGLKSLVDLIPSPDTSIVDLALKSLINFASEDSYCERLRALQVIPAILPHLTSKNQEIILDVAKLLLPLVKDVNAKKEIAPSIPTLAKLIASRNEGLSKSALLVISSLSEVSDNLKAIGDADCIPGLLSLLDSYDDSVREAAVKIIADLSQQKENKDKLRTLEGIPKIVNLFASSKLEIKERAALTISNLSDDPANRKIVRDERGLYPLVELLRYPVDSVRERVAWCIANFLADPDSQPVVREAGGFELIVQLLATKSDSLVSYALKAILILAQNVTNRPHLINAKAREHLQPLTSSTNRTVQLASTKALTFLQ
eukprot:TRINITY_DN1982_c0_g1_i9.p1 TRINITY_DN1982_c0_g1~~TRINITY_DN1982_c0_g1_i9.p1  ORF type:complete len:1452 (+),score=527.97 TRINITY_DN1982_c0_g1_i9:1107-5462(+)